MSVMQTGLTHANHGCAHLLMAYSLKTTKVFFLEIKCPCSHRGKEIGDFDQQSHATYLLQNGKLRLRNSNPYLQVTLYNMGLKQCLIYIYSTKQPSGATVIVPRYCCFLSETISQLEEFYFLSG